MTGECGGDFDDSDENSPNAQQLCVHEQASGVCVYHCTRL